MTSEQEAEIRRPYCECDDIDCNFEHRPHTPGMEAMIAAKLEAQGFGSGYRVKAHKLMRLALLAGRLMELEEHSSDRQANENAGAGDGVSRNTTSRLGSPDAPRSTNENAAGTR